MGAILLRHPLVHFYLLSVGVLGVAFLWDYWRNPPGGGHDARTLPNERALEGARVPPLPGPQEFYSVSKGELRTDREREPTGPLTT